MYLYIVPLVYFRAGASHAAFRSAIVASSTSSSTVHRKQSVREVQSRAGVSCVYTTRSVRDQSSAGLVFAKLVAYINASVLTRLQVGVNVNDVTVLDERNRAANLQSNLSEKRSLKRRSERV